VTTVTCIPRDDAVAEIGAAMESRDFWILGIAPGYVAATSARLAAAHTPGACCLDFSGTVLRAGFADAASVAAVAEVLAPDGHTAVCVVPKQSVPAATLGQAVGGGVRIPADGSQDILFVGGVNFHGSFTPFVPTLLVDAIGTFDPRNAAWLYANDVRMAS
jgi:hypothetical protein